MHRIPGSLLSKPVRVLVVGCGGNGSAIAGGLPYLHQAMIARGHPHGLAVTLQDGDTVSPTNCVRQPFSEGEIGHNKATILVTRMNLFWGLRWTAVPRYLDPRSDAAKTYDVLISCVDSGEARNLVARLCTAKEARVHYWLDLGNLNDRGQYLLGQPRNGVNSDGPGRLQTAPERWPEIVTPGGVPNLPSCSAMEALTRQEPFVNQVLANHALSMLARLFSAGLEYHGGLVNLSTGKASSIPVPEVPAPEIPTPKPVRRRRRGAVPA